ncbi:ribonuclease E [Haemophilus influenzae]|uniref:Ribonuclease E n=1 Tax=Haemophilus influenzae TaxID=727 RepID=A0A2X1RIF4_HAEIF|nr:ribonuclease E [Haemophilus influenzae]
MWRPDFINRVKLYQGEVPLFSHYQIESQIESAFQREVRLPSGGSIVIDVTEALTAIDINSARSTRGGDIEETALNTNLEAADEIARQLRLRDLGGLVVIDFIDMTPIRHQREVENRIRDAVRPDRARIQISRISRFGLVGNVTSAFKPIIGPNLRTIFALVVKEQAKCVIMNLFLYLFCVCWKKKPLKENTKQVHTIVPVQIASYLLNEKRKAISNIEKRHNVDIIVAPNEAMETPHFSVFRYVMAKK